MNSTQALAIFIYFSLIANPLSTYIDRISSKEVGADKRATQGFVESQRTDEGSEKELGSKEIERPDGGKDKIYYSVTTKEEEAEQQKGEKEKVEKSWDMLRNIIIDKRTK
jgi:hypothetical protein